MIPLDKKIVHVKVKTHCAKRMIISYVDDVALISLKESAQNNKANEELCQFLSQYFEKPVKIIRGKTSPKKVISVG